MHKLAIFLSIVTTLSIGYAALRHLQPHERWVVYYGSQLPAEAFLPFDVIVFDRQMHPPLPLLLQNHKILLGYVSLGEAETFRDNYQWIQDHQLILKTDERWKGNPVIDVRKPEWEAYVLNTIIPAVLAQGFNGIILDTADSVIWLEHTQPQNYAGLQQATVQLIKHIRDRYPNIKIMLNRGFPLLPQIGDDIDMVLAESIYPSPSTQNTYPPLPNETYQNYLTVLKAAQKQSQHLKVYTLDYLEKGHVDGIRSFYRLQRSHGFIPYVGPSGLQDIIMEPE